MKLAATTIQGWPKLAWLARLRPGLAEVSVRHGPGVEVAADWLAEAVWDRDFAQGDFDRTDLVFGTGIRCRPGRVTFVSSGSALDRLWYAQSAGEWFVANSLPALLAGAGLSLRDDYDYTRDMRTLTRGLKECVRRFPVAEGEVRVVYFHNLAWDGSDMAEEDKADTAPRFGTYGDYREYLFATARRLRANAESPGRRSPVASLVTVSSGYDSPAAAVVAREAGCRQAATFRKDTSVRGRDDSGEPIARRLGLSCQGLSRTARQYPLEPAVWAVTGRPGIINWTLFDYPEPLGLLFTGCHGDKMWGREPYAPADAFAMPSISELGFGEFRLFRGVFHCPVPYWGMRRLRELREVSNSAEMAPWQLGGLYDRPIARRIVEEAGVPRGEFAVRKKLTSCEAFFLWPYSPDARARFADFLRSRGLHAPGSAELYLRRRISHLDHLAALNLPRKLRLRKGVRHLLRLKGNGLVFQWANAELKETYRQGLEAGAQSRDRGPARSLMESL